MSERVGHIKVDGYWVYYREGVSYVSSAIVSPQKKIKNYDCLRRRGLHNIKPETIPALDKYFRKNHRGKGTRAILFALEELAAAEKNPKFEDVFHTDNFFTGLLAGFRKSYNPVIGVESPEGVSGFR